MKLSSMKCRPNGHAPRVCPEEAAAAADCVPERLAAAEGGAGKGCGSTSNDGDPSVEGQETGRKPNLDIALLPAPEAD